MRLASEFAILMSWILIGSQSFYCCVYPLGTKPLDFHINILIPHTYFPGEGRKLQNNKNKKY
jgi:hypothetical protein